VAGRTDHGPKQTLIMNLVLGIAGAFLGNFLATRVINVRYSSSNHRHCHRRRALAPPSPRPAARFRFRPSANV
jgi:hypothetical protein